MQHFICRQKKAGQHVYMVKDTPQWNVMSKKTYSGLLRGKLSLCCNGEEVFLLYQKSVLKQFLMNLPFARLFFFNPFTIFKDGMPVGQVQRIHYGFSFYINSDVFELRLHSGFILSLVQNKQQIAVFSRTGDGQYSVDCNKNGDANIGILLLCCAFFDEGYMVDRGFAIKNVITNDLYSERATWTSK